MTDPAFLWAIRWFVHFISCLLLWHSAAVVGAVGQPVAPGRYVAVGDWPTLVVKKAPGGRMHFEIDALGANRHVCSFSGVLLGNIAVADGAADPGASARPHAGFRYSLAQQV